MKTSRSGRTALAAGLALSVLTGVGTARPAGAETAPLAVYDALAASRSVTMQPRAAAVLSLVVTQYVGATHALLDSAPRAQGYAATYGVPVANDARGAGIPFDYGGQCYANYPGNAQADCGIPISGVVAPRPPDGSPFDGGVFFARATAAGDPVLPEKLAASGITEGGGMALGDVVRIGFSQSNSRAFIDADGVHAVTASAAENIQVGEALHIVSLTARAEAVHNGDLEAAQGSAATTFEGVTIGGVPVEIGPEGVMVQGQKVSEAPSPDAAAVRDAMAAEGLTIEPLAGSAIRKDENTGFVTAETHGVRVLFRRPSGDRFDLTLGDATARAAAVRAGTSGSDDLFLASDEAPSGTVTAAATLLAVPGRRRRS